MQVLQAPSQEQALSLLLQTLQKLQFKRAAFGDGSASLLYRARLIAAVQPCVYSLMAAGALRTFVCFWVGVYDPRGGRSLVGSSLSREVGSGEVGWGKFLRSSSEVHEDTAATLLQVWRSLLRGL